LGLHLGKPFGTAGTFFHPSCNEAENRKSVRQDIRPAGMMDLGVTGGGMRMIGNVSAFPSSTTDHPPRLPA
jgi:hypothetical protein